jgi:uncharacterized RDD family membrane protein YckC
MSQLAINTAQNVNIKFNAASVGERILASFLDLLIKIAYIIIIGYFIFYLLGLSDWMKGLDDWSAAAIVIVFAFPVMIYSIVFESLLEGQTLGKKITKIKVVKLDGYQASFGDYLIRWFFRIIENNIMGGLIGLIAMMVNSKTQRIGDMAAGTAVITLKNNVNISHTILEEVHTEYQPKYPMVIKLSDNDMRIVKETFNRAIAQDDFEMINKLVEKIERVTGIKKQDQSNRDFIKTLLKDYNFYTQNM